MGERPLAWARVMGVQPYYQDDHVTLYHGDHAEILPTLGQTFDLIVADPPYGETSLTWDRWPIGWPALMTDYARSMWVFGSMRMFLDRAASEFGAWKLSQDVVWEKHTGSGFTTDRFRRVHEHALHWYRGEWRDVHHDTPRVPRTGPEVARAVRSPREKGWHGAVERTAWEDDGTRLQTSVIRARSMHRNGAINETEKPLGTIVPLISYACPPGGVVLDPFAGSCSTGVAARHLGIRSVLIEKREQQCEKAARRLAAAPLDFGGVA